jgi:dTDP-4-dehydrorhamnose reductase
MKKTVLIIGAQGMLGQELVKEFSRDAYDVVAWDRNDIDVTQHDVLTEKITTLWPDIIINATAYNAVDLCEQDDTEYAKARALNSETPGILAKIAASLQAVFVHYSTDYVFDGQRPQYLKGRAPQCCGQRCKGCQYMGPEESLPYFAYTEDDRPHPISRYGQSKYGGEQNVARNGSQYYIIRLSKLFGLPASSAHAKRSFFDMMLEMGRKNDEVKVVNGEVSCFTYAPDLAHATREIIEVERPSGIYHVTNSGACTWYDGVKELYRLAKLPTKIIPVESSEFPRPAKRPQSSVLVATKIDPLRSWQEALAEYVQRIK